MPRLDKLRERWDETGSENENSTSYNIPFPDIHSSEDEFEEQCPSQYQLERTNKMLVQLLQHVLTAITFGGIV
jgi:hypothetical protein